MPTENPKISAYVPQAVYDRFKQFQEERKLSMSQAATELIAEYFGISLKEEITSQSTSGLPERLAQVEKEIEWLRELYSRLASKVEYREFMGEPQEIVEKDYSLLDKLNSSLQSELQENIDNGLSSNLQSEPQELQDNLNHIQMELVPSLIEQCEEQVSKLQDELKSELPISKRIELDHKLIAQRLGVSEKYVHNQKKLNIEDFAKWTSKKDPDSISWSFAKDGNKVYYYPYSSLTSELKSSLMNWIDEHMDVK